MKRMRYSRLPPNSSLRRLVVGGKELAYQVAVAGVYLNAVEPGFAGEIHCGAEVVGNLKDFIPCAARARRWGSRG